MNTQIKIFLFISLTAAAVFLNLFIYLKSGSKAVIDKNSAKDIENILVIKTALDDLKSRKPLRFDIEKITIPSITPGITPTLEINKISTPSLGKEILNLKILNASQKDGAAGTMKEKITALQIFSAITTNNSLPQNNSEIQFKTGFPNSLRQTLLFFLKKELPQIKEAALEQNSEEDAVLILGTANGD